MTIEHPIVVALRRHERRGGPQILADAAPPNLHVEPTMLDAAPTRGGAGRMTDVWSTAPRPTRERRAPRRAATSSSRRVGGRQDGCSTWRAAADTSPRGCARRAARSSPATPRRDAADVLCPREAHPVRGRELRRGHVTRIAAAPLRASAAAVHEFARVASGSSRRGHALLERGGEQAERCATRRTCATSPRTSGATLRAGRPRGRAGRALRRSASSSAVAASGRAVRRARRSGA
jgi:hypothetical protein